MSKQALDDMQARQWAAEAQLEVEAYAGEAQRLKSAVQSRCNTIRAKNDKVLKAKFRKLSDEKFTALTQQVEETGSTGFEDATTADEYRLGQDAIAALDAELRNAADVGREVDGMLKDNPPSAQRLERDIKRMSDAEFAAFTNKMGR